MRHLTLVVAAIASVAAFQAPAGDWKAQPLAVKRQLVTQIVECMKKRMSVDRHISYNSASKECRDQVEGRLEKSSATPLVAADSSANSSAK